MTDPNPTPPAPPGTGDKDWQAEAEKWKALARKHEDNSKKNAAELAELKAAGDAKQSDMDKIMAKLTAAEERSAKAERRALLTEVSGKTGLSLAKIERLKGETVDELLADAGEVFDWKESKEDGGEGDGKNDEGGGKSGGRVATAPPKERLVPNPGDRGEPKTDDPISLAAKVPRMFE